VIENGEISFCDALNRPYSVQNAVTLSCTISEFARHVEATHECPPSHDST
jgi:hypothetical protein